jgi:hypothetical protein
MAVGTKFKSGIDCYCAKIKRIFPQLHTTAIVDHAIHRVGPTHSRQSSALVAEELTNIGTHL